MLLTLPLLPYAFTFVADNDKNRPVSRVVQLLKEMQEQLEKDQKTDEEVYEKMACWCKKNDREKLQAIKDAEVSINQLNSKIESLTAQSSRLSTEIDDLNKEISANRVALDKAQALRSKQLEEFNAEEKDMVQSITALNSAIVVLSKHHPSLLQQESLYGLTELLKKHLDNVSEDITLTQKRKIRAFLQAPSYNAQSGEIFGILKNMSETFTPNLEATRKKEKENAKSFAQLREAKMEEIQAAQDQADKKLVEFANAQRGAAEAKQSLEDTQNSLSADEQFLMQLKEKCAMMDEEWQARQKTRQQEVVAVSKAIEVLAGDDARDNFSKVYNFVQIDNQSLRANVAEMLSRTAKQFNNPKIAEIASKVRLDAFTKVKNAIDDMIEKLNVEKADEVKHKDWCVENFHENESNRNEADRNRQDEDARIDHLGSTFSTLKGVIKKLDGEIKDLNLNLKRAGEDRAAQNQEFQQILADQRTAQESLAKAIQFLKNFYEKESKETALIQLQGPDAPDGFSAYKKGAGNSVILLLEQIVADTKAMKAELTHDEEEGQKAYEEFVVQTNRSSSAKEDQKIDSDAEKAQAERELSEAQDTHAGFLKELEQLSNSKADLHKSCDFLQKNFDIRQAARDQEIDALRQAKSILSGANFKNFLQKF